MLARATLEPPKTLTDFACAVHAAFSKNCAPHLGVIWVLRSFRIRAHLGAGQNLAYFRFRWVDVEMRECRAQRLMRVAEECVEIENEHASFCNACGFGKTQRFTNPAHGDDLARAEIRKVPVCAETTVQTREPERRERVCFSWRICAAKNRGEVDFGRDTHG